MKEYRAVFEALEEYDRTHVLPTTKRRINLYLRNRTLQKLDELKKKTGKARSQIVEEAVAAFDPELRSRHRRNS